MNHGDRPDLDALVTMFAHGVATREELIRIGVPSAVITRRTRPGGPWRRPLPGVVLLGDAPPGQAQLMRAALCHAGPGSVVTGHYALAAHGVLAVNGDAPVHVLVPSVPVRRRTPGVIVERCSEPVPTEMIGRLSVTAAARAALDGARRLALGLRPGMPWAHPALREAEILLASVIGHGPCTAHTLLAGLSTRSRGAWLPRRILRRFVDQPRVVDHALTEAAGTGEPRPEEDDIRWPTRVRRAG